MRRLSILHTESSLELGGQEFRILAEATGMMGRGHRVYLAVQASSEINACAERNGLPVACLRMTKARYPALIREFQTLIRTLQIDVLNTHSSVDSWAASIAGRLSGRKPLIVRTRHKSTPIRSTFHHRLLYKRLPHGVIATAQAIRDELMRRLDLEDWRIVSIPTGVNLDCFHPENSDVLVKQELGITPEAPLVGTVAFLRSYKGINYFLDAAGLVLQEIPQARFVIVGDGPEKTRLIQQVIRSGLSDKVRFTGFREDVPKWLSLLDVFVLPSIEAEGTPQTVLQALAMERPVVACEVGGVPEVIHDGETGFLTRPKDVRGLAASVVRVLQNREQAGRMGRAGRRLVTEAYTLEAMLDQTEEFYERLLRMEKHGRYNG